MTTAIRILIYISHNHQDHTGNVENLISSYNVGTVYLNSYDLDWLGKKCRKAGCDVVMLSQGDSFTVGEAEATILFGPAHHISSNGSYVNNSSLITRIEAR